jgi:hypothetical protein
MVIPRQRRRAHKHTADVFREKTMKTNIFATTLVIAMANFGGAQADTASDRYVRCTAVGEARDLSAGCVDLRAAINADMRLCQSAPVKAGVTEASISPASASHRSKARYLICAAQVDLKYASGSN